MKITFILLRRGLHRLEQLAIAHDEPLSWTRLALLWVWLDLGFLESSLAFNDLRTGRKTLFLGGGSGEFLARGTLGRIRSRRRRQCGPNTRLANSARSGSECTVEASSAMSWFPPGPSLAQPGRLQSRTHTWSSSGSDPARTRRPHSLCTALPPARLGTDH